VAWVPLFFFALALGYLFQRTGSLIAPIVLHVSLNATTMLILYLIS
jgi:membrane protease YdiL (CAAX protease family)